MKKTKRYVNTLAFQMDVTARLYHNLSQKLFNKDVKNNISLEEYIVLDTIVCYPQIDANMLAKTLIKEKAVIDKILSKLIKRKLLLEIKPKGKDIQVKHFELTKEGCRIYNEVIPKNDGMAGVLAKFMTDTELMAFAKTLLKIKNIMISLSEVDYKN